jgi:hypothetical protein
MAVDATTGRSFKTGIPRRLVDAPFRAFSGNVFVWDVTADGKEFLINAAAQESAAHYGGVELAGRLEELRVDRSGVLRPGILYPYKRTNQITPEIRAMGYRH